MFELILGYFVIGIVFIIWRLFYHTLYKKSARENFIKTLKNDFLKLLAQSKKLFLSNCKIFKIIFVLLAMIAVCDIISIENYILNILETIMSAIMFLMLAIVFSPTENSMYKGFPNEIFAFIYSVVFMFYSAESIVVDMSFTLDFFTEDIWIYGYIITIISYVVCMATLRRFMERDLTTEEIIILGMVMMTALEFITYYGIGFFSNIKIYNPQAFESNIFGDFTSIINQGIFIASQSQILERGPMEIWGYILLNGTDVLTTTMVLGYVVQKFFGSSAH